MIPTTIHVQGLEFQNYPGLCPPSIFLAAYIPLLENLLNQLSAVKCLDMGCAGGVLALSLWHQDRQWTCVDIDPDAVALTKVNSQRLARPVDVLVSDWFAAVEGRWDFIISNPPYTSQAEWDAAPQYHEVLRATSVLGGPTGIECYQHLIAHAGQYLTAQGRLALVSDCSHVDQLVAMAAEQAMIREHITYSGPTALSVFKLADSSTHS